MKKKNLWMWIVSIFVILWGFTSPFALIAGALLLPVAKWQELLARYIKNPLKITLIVISIILAFIVTCLTAEPSQNEDTDVSLSSSFTQSVSSETSSEDVISTSSEAPISSDDVSSEGTVSSEPVNNTPVSSTPVSSTPVSSEDSVVVPPVHTHSFSAADCTNAEKCSCGAVGAAALGHNFANGSCTRCGASDPDYSAGTEYVLNVNPNAKENKFHKPSCSYLPEGTNRKDIVATREEIINQGYVPCKKCNP